LSLDADEVDARWQGAPVIVFAIPVEDHLTGGAESVVDGADDLSAEVVDGDPEESFVVVVENDGAVFPERIGVVAADAEGGGNGAVVVKTDGIGFDGNEHGGITGQIDPDIADIETAGSIDLFQDSVGDGVSVAAGGHFEADEGMLKGNGLIIDHDGADAIGDAGIGGIEIDIDIAAGGAGVDRVAGLQLLAIDPDDAICTVAIADATRGEIIGRLGDRSGIGVGMTPKSHGKTQGG